MRVGLEEAQTYASSSALYLLLLTVHTPRLPTNSMSRWGMNSYLYAPKDDDKHRANWRELYTLEEADELSQLIREASSRGVDFIYAISPGIDITFSKNSEVALLKRKLDQVCKRVNHSLEN